MPHPERDAPGWTPNPSPAARRRSVFFLCVLCLPPISDRVRAEESGSPVSEESAIENFHVVSPNLFSTGEPVGEAAFAELRRRGVKTIVSVDGAKPNVLLAKQYGMRYVHVPIKYDGIPREQALCIAKAVRDLPGPVVIHCHHGKHRGPAAVALACMTSEGWTRERALEWMKRAGTSPEYQGLYRDVREFVPPTEREISRLPADFPESVEVSTLVDSMVEISEHWDQLKETQQRNFRGTERRPNLDPIHEAVLVVEHYQELQRTAEAAEKGDAFLFELKRARDSAEKLRASISLYRENPSPARLQAAREAFMAANHRCDSCHAKYRNH